MASYDIIGNIAILKFHNNVKREEKLEQARQILKANPHIKTVLEKVEKVKGRLRTIKTKFLAGEKNFVTVHKEGGCLFKLDIRSCYFSPRLSHERLEVAKLVKKFKPNSKVLVMFSGVAPYPIIISKFARPKKIVSIELGRECCKYAKENLLLNKIFSGVEIIQGDVKRIIPKLKSKNEKFDIIVMPRPNLKETFLREALLVSKRGTLIIYYGFSQEKGKDKMVQDLVNSARKLKRKIKILNVKEAGDIAPYQHRYRIEIKVLNNI